MMPRKRKTCHIEEEEEDEDSFNISGPKPKFFQIILLDTLRQGRLAIPKKFVRDYGTCLSSRVMVEAADGIKWQMELSKGGLYEAWLQKGWKEFSEYYSLQLGYFLVFQRQHKSHFTVFIFDTTLLEIGYPAKPNCIPNFNQNPTQFNGFIKTEDSDTQNLDSQGKSNGSRVSQRIEAADGFSSTNPWFKLVLKSRNHRGIINAPSVPFGFIREHMKNNMEIGTVILKVEGKQCSWPTKLNVYGQHSFATLSAGWRAFARDNSLKLRDVCVFELVAPKTFMVHFFRQSPSKDS